MGRGLLIIDMQQALIPVVWRGEELARRTAALADSARGVRDGHAPVAAGDPAAGLTAEQIIEHHNRILSQAIHPGGRLRLVRAADPFAAP